MAIEVRVRNFQKFKGRADVEHNSWFRMSNRILEDHEFFDFDAAEFKVWVYFLCLASQKNNDLIQVSYQHAHQVCSIKKTTLDSAIKKLIDIKCIELPRNRDGRGRYVDDTQTGATDRQTDITDRHYNIAQSGDFAAFWDGYPRKVGKGKAAKAYWKLIKAGVGHEDICRSRDNYREYCKSHGTEPRFIKHGPTFLNEWEDWLDPETGQTEDFKNQSTSQPSHDWETTAARVLESLVKRGTGSKASAEIEQDLGAELYRIVIKAGTQRIRDVQRGNFQLKTIAELLKNATELMRGA